MTICSDEAISITRKMPAFGLNLNFLNPIKTRSAFAGNTTTILDGIKNKDRDYSKITVR